MHGADYHQARRRQVDVDEEFAAVHLDDAGLSGSKRPVQRPAEIAGNTIAFMHDPIAAVAEIRHQRNRLACRARGVQFLERLGIHGRSYPRRST